MIRQDAAFTCRYRAPGSAPQRPIRYAIGQTTLGMVLAGKTELGICAILLGADRDALRAELATAFPDATLQAIRDRCNLSWPPSPPISTTATPMRRWRWTWAAPPSSSRCGRRSPPSRPARPAATASWRASSARPTPRAPWPAPAPPTCWPWPFLPSRGAGRWRAIRLSLGRRTQARAARRRARPMMPETCAMAPDLDRHDWEAIARALDARGNARLPGLLDPAQCAALAAGYASPDGYRSRIVMARHGFGRGEYKYFPTRCRRCCKRCARRCIRAWRPSPTAGTNCSAIRNGSRHARRVPGAMPCGRPEAAHAAHPAIWGRRLQLPAPGPVRRAGLSLAGGHPAVAARPGLQRRRIRHDGDRLQRPARRGHRAGPGRRAALHGQSPAGSGQARRHAQGRHAPWREPRARRFAPYRGSDFS